MRKVSRFSLHYLSARSKSGESCGESCGEHAWLGRCSLDLDELGLPKIPLSNGGMKSPMQLTSHQSTPAPLIYSSLFLTLVGSVMS